MSLMQASRHRDTHTAAAIKHIKLPTGIPGIFKGRSPLNGRAAHPTATGLFLPSFFSPGKKAEKKRKKNGSISAND